MKFLTLLVLSALLMATTAKKLSQRMKTNQDRDLNEIVSEERKRMLGYQEGKRRNDEYKDADEIVSFSETRSSQAKELVGTGVNFGQKSLASSADITNIVNFHNKYRRQEGASNMNELSYSAYLADMASEWANGCNFQHGHPPRVNPPYSWIGQNLYAVSVPMVNFTRAILTWYVEKSRYDYDARSCLPGSVCGHYTAVVWWETLKVGCGYAICPTLSGTGFYNAGYIVCNYGPGGNYVGEYPFLKGPACSKCPAGYSCNLGLCKAP